MCNRKRKIPSAAEGRSGNRREDLPRLLISEPLLLSNIHQPSQILHYYCVPCRKAGWHSITSGAAYPSPEMPSLWAGQKNHHLPEARESHHHCPVLASHMSQRCPLPPALVATCWMVTLAGRAQGSSLELTGTSWPFPAWLQRFISITAQRWLDNGHQTIHCSVLESSVSK